MYSVLPLIIVYFVLKYNIFQITGIQTTFGIPPYGVLTQPFRIVFIIPLKYGMLFYHTVDLDSISVPIL